MGVMKGVVYSGRYVIRVYDDCEKIYDHCGNPIDTSEIDNNSLINIYKVLFDFEQDEELKNEN